jgi:GT2 family glycosyltransferase
MDGSTLIMSLAQRRSIDCAQQADARPVTLSDVRTSVAAVIVNFNGGKYLRACLESLFAQSHPLLKVLIVDNASTDGSLDGIAQDPRCQIVRLEKNIGFAAACNYAAASTDGCEWLLVLNPDVELESDWLERMMSAACEWPDAAFFSGRLLNFRQRDLFDGAGDVLHVSGAHWRRGHGKVARGRFVADEEVFSACAAAALYRRDVFLDAGGFDESFFCYGEDVDLGFRLRLMGERCRYVPHAVAYHVGSASSGRNSDFTVYHGHRNLVWLYVKNMPGPLLLLYLPQHLVWSLVTIVWFMLRGQGATILRAKWDALRGLRHILRERRRIQLRRKVRIGELLRVMDRGLLTPYRRSGVS